MALQQALTADTTASDDITETWDQTQITISSRTLPFDDLPTFEYTQNTENTTKIEDICAQIFGFGEFDGMESMNELENITVQCIRTQFGTRAHDPVILTFSFVCILLIG